MLKMLGMRVSFIGAAAFMAISMSGLAQQSSGFKSNPSSPASVKHNAPLPVGKTPGAGMSASTANAKDLQALEHEGATKPVPSSQTVSKASSHSAGKKTVARLKPLPNPPNPAINFGAAPQPKPGLVSQGPDPYKGRIREH